ncbi:MAG TPA: DNA starvation/stationary phase protection protein [Jatrophihabitans sp.]|jgi:starvation-inducible DNA-binding protein|uniref:Dps family protein n=1 Tax=Jatrophihabitans sp. TaxID=1932789 RepID=UPI002F02AEE5
MSTDSSPAARQRTAYTIPGIAQGDADDLVALLQDRLNALNDLALTLKHIHWNVVGTHFIAVHTMLDPQVDAVRLMVDETAERIATLGGSPIGTPGALVATRSWDDYSLGRATALEHLAALDLVYGGVIESHRKAIQATEEPDPVSQDMLIGQAKLLEQYQWFVRAHLESADGRLTTTGAHTERQAARTAPADAVQDANAGSTQGQESS